MPVTSGSPAPTENRPTTALIGHVLSKIGVASAIGGNIGAPGLSLPALGASGVYVLELSSYQLELLPTAVFDVAILLNITPDHLDRHGGMDGYIAAKRVFSTARVPATSPSLVLMTEPSRRTFDGLIDTSAATIVPLSVREACKAAFTSQMAG